MASTVLTSGVLPVLLISLTFWVTPGLMLTTSTIPVAKDSIHRELKPSRASWGVREPVDKVAKAILWHEGLQVPYKMLNLSYYLTLPPTEVNKCMNKEVFLLFFLKSEWLPRNASGHTRSSSLNSVSHRTIWSKGTSFVWCFSVFYLQIHGNLSGTVFYRSRSMIWLKIIITLGPSSFSPVILTEHRNVTFSLFLIRDFDTQYYGQNSVLTAFFFTLKVLYRLKDSKSLRKSDNIAFWLKKMCILRSPITFWTQSYKYIEEEVRKKCHRGSQQWWWCRNNTPQLADRSFQIHWNPVQRHLEGEGRKVKSR